MQSISKILLGLFFLAFFDFWQVNAQTKIIPYQQLPTSSGSPTGSNMFFGASMTTTSMTITFEGPSDRWIGFGFGSFMTSTDALIYSNGHAIFSHPLSWRDYYINLYSTSGVVHDANQNWNIVSNTVALGQRTVVASRALNTGDASDAVISFSATSLNLVWARGASADYTIAYHGSTNRANNINLLWLSSPTASFTTPSNTVCAGSSLSFSNVSTGGLTSYTWSFEGGLPSTSSSTNPSITYSFPGTYSVSLIAANAIGSNTISQLSYVTVNPTLTPVVTVVQSSGQNPLCAGAPVSFSANTVNGGVAPSFQWKLNGLNVGTNSPNYTNNTLSANSVVTCVMTSNALCSVPQNVTSAVVNLTVISTAPASVTVSLLTGNNPLCVGTPVTFSATPGNGGNSPSFQWKVNNSNVGSNSSTYSNALFNNGDFVSCELFSSSACASSSLGISNVITMTVSSFLVPAVNIVLSGGANPACSGTPLTFSAFPFNGGTSPTYQWLLNGNPSGANSSTFGLSVLNVGVSVSCILTSNSPCSSPLTASSPVLTVTVFPIPPAPVITPSGNISLCAGDSLTLHSSAGAGNLWSNGATTPSIIVSSAGNYSLIQTLNGCSSLASNQVTISISPLPILSIVPIGPICLDEAAVVLQGIPSGGNFSGPGVIGNLFTPSLVPEGIISVVYTYTNSIGCSDTISTSISVSACMGEQLLKPVSDSFLIYPNPTDGPINLVSLGSKIEQVLVTDTGGRVIFSENCGAVHQYKLQLSHLNSGLYILEIQFPSTKRWYKVSIDK